MNKKAHTCPKCDGQKKIDGKDCPTCSGSGIVWETLDFEKSEGDILRKVNEKVQ